MERIKTIKDPKQRQSETVINKFHLQFKYEIY
jgi:hypothetical protein